MRMFVVGLLLLATGMSHTALAAKPLFSPFVTAKPIYLPNTVPAFLGEVQGDGFRNVGNQAIVVMLGTTLYPLCLTDENLAGNAAGGWLGIGKVVTQNNKNVFVCESYAGSTLAKNQILSPATVFDLNGVENPVWLRSTMQTPEPRGAIAIAVQIESSRKMFACQFSSGTGDQQKTFVGYIGDHGKCHGVNNTGAKEVAEEYMVYASIGTKADTTPRYGWVIASKQYLPHGGAQGLADATVDSIQKKNATTSRPLCRVWENNNFWPGYITAAFPTGKAKEEYTCTYFTDFNKITTTKETGTFEVLRENPSKPAVDWGVIQKNGRVLYFCTATATKNGQTVDHMFGFTQDGVTCTDGSKNTATPIDPTTTWSAPTIVKVNFSETEG